MKTAPPEIKDAREQEHLARAGRLVARVMEKLRARIRPGVSTAELDDLARRWIEEEGARPAFLGYRGYPASLCVSINEEVVHGIPSEKRILREGDIVSLDLGVILDGWYGDMARTWPVGKVSAEAERLLRASRDALEAAVEALKHARRLGDVSHAIQRLAESRGYQVVREYVGHGIGRALHEPPEVPNFGEPDTGVRLEPGMVLAIEPMLTAGTWKVRTLSDGWTVVTEDGSLASHWEDMVALTEAGPVILTK